MAISFALGAATQPAAKFEAEELVAKRIKIVDDKGNILAFITANERGGMLGLSSPKGEMLAMLGAGAGECESMLALGTGDSTRKGGVMLQTWKGFGVVDVLNDKGKSGVKLNGGPDSGFVGVVDTDGKSGITLGLTPDPIIYLNSKDGKRRVITP